MKCLPVWQKNLKSDNIKCWHRGGTRRTFTHHWWAREVGQPLSKTVCHYPVELKTGLFPYPSKFTPRCIHRDTCSSAPGHKETNVHKSRIYGSPMSFNTRMHKGHAVYPQKGLLYSNEKELTKVHKTWLSQCVGHRSRTQSKWSWLLPLYKI